MLKKQSSNLASVSPPKTACYSENVRACARERGRRASGGGSVGAGDEGKGGRERGKEGGVGGYGAEWPFPSFE